MIITFKHFKVDNNSVTIKTGQEDGSQQSGLGVLGRRRRSQRECESAQTSVAAAEPDRALAAPPLAGRAQNRPSQTKRLFGHRAIPPPAEHGPDLRRGHGAPTRAEEIQDVVAVVVSRSSTVR